VPVSKRRADLVNDLPRFDRADDRNGKTVRPVMAGVKVAQVVHGQFRDRRQCAARAVVIRMMLRVQVFAEGARRLTARVLLLIFEPCQALTAQTFHLPFGECRITQHIVEQIDQHRQIFPQRLPAEADMMRPRPDAQIRADVLKRAVNRVEVATLCTAHQGGGRHRREAVLSRRLVDRTAAHDSRQHDRLRLRVLVDQYGDTVGQHGRRDVIGIR
jgi:hypothetical protein